MKKIGIATVYTGNNYGSSLQSYATNHILRKMGFEPELLGIKGSIKKGSDLRVGKLFHIFLRLITNPQQYKKVSVYKKSISKKISNESIALFDLFTTNYLKPKKYSWRQLKRIGNSTDYIAFLCGSDQIWNGESLYVDPFYYLRFTNFDKRVAFAPSYGRDFVADYNRKLISKYVNGIKFLSNRERSGVLLTEKFTNRKSLQLLDPTLVLTNDEWSELAVSCDKTDTMIPDRKYLLCYFLNTPSDKAREYMQLISQREELEIIEISNNNLDGLSRFVDTGPLEFLKLVSHAEYIFTDSFHGTAFSINFNKKFFVFERMYQSGAGAQSTRITSLLNLLGLENQFEPNMDIINQPINYSKTNEILDNERKKSYDYIFNAISGTR